jgi:hypothetical protein
MATKSARRGEACPKDRFVHLKLLLDRAPPTSTQTITNMTSRYSMNYLDSSNLTAAYLGHEHEPEIPGQSIQCH